MIEKGFIEYISGRTKANQKDLIEKDLLLQQLLEEFQYFDYFKNNLVFKGGTCLIKCYLNYYRFSEDLDFTWVNQKVFQNKSEKQVRKQLSAEINQLMGIFLKTSMKLNLNFQKTKTNKKYVEFGGSNKFVTFKIWYESQISGREQFIKIQINFVELFKYDFENLAVKNIMRNVDLAEIEFLFPEQSKIISKSFKIKVYSLEEILVEKIRAILTRQALKSRDFIDVYFILKHLKTNIGDYLEIIIAKTVFMLRYEKYLVNLLGKENILNKFDFKNEENLLLIPLDKDFDKFNEELKLFLITVLIKIKKNYFQSDNKGSRRNILSRL